MVCVSVFFFGWSCYLLVWLFKEITLDESLVGHLPLDSFISYTSLLVPLFWSFNYELARHLNVGGKIINFTIVTLAGDGQKSPSGLTQESRIKNHAPPTSYNIIYTYRERDRDRNEDREIEREGLGFIISCMIDDKAITSIPFPKVKYFAKAFLKLKLWQKSLNI